MLSHREGNYTSVLESVNIRRVHKKVGKVTYDSVDTDETQPATSGSISLNTATGVQENPTYETNMSQPLTADS